MVNWSKIGLGIVIFFAGYILSVILQFIIPPMIDVFNGIGGTSVIGSISWMALILINIFSMVLVPCGFIIMGILENDSEVTYKGILVASLIFFFGMLILLKIYYWFPIMAGMFNESETIALGCFWIGSILLWLGSVLVAPITQFIQARANL